MTGTALITDPMSVFAFLAGTVAFIYWVSGLPRFEKIFEYTPQVIYVYFLPMFATTVGITPSSSPAYDWLTRYLLPFALLLLMISIDLKAILKLGPIALFMVLAGTLGIIVGGPVSYVLFKGFLPADAWTGFAALSGSWIGGTATPVRATPASSSVATSTPAPISKFRNRPVSNSKSPPNALRPASVHAPSRPTWNSHSRYFFGYASVTWRGRSGSSDRKSSCAAPWRGDTVNTAPTRKNNQDRIL